MKPGSISDLRHQQLARHAEGLATSGSASATILEKIKGNQASRQDGDTCVFQQLQVDTTVVRQLQGLRISKDGRNHSKDDGSLQANGVVGSLQEDGTVPAAGASISTVNRPKGSIGSPKVAPRRAISSSATGSSDGPSIYIPVSSERIRIQDLRDALKDEYAARYCELIGVAPSQQNMSLVQKLMPFEKCKISQSTQQNGIGRTERRNNVVIQPCFHVPKVVGPSADEVPYELLTLDVLHQTHRRGGGSSGVDGAGGRPGSEAVVETDRDAEPSDAAQHEAAKSAVSFERYKHEFVFPYNLKERFEGVAPALPPKGGGAAKSPAPPPQHSGSGVQRTKAPHLATTRPVVALPQIGVKERDEVPPTDEVRDGGGGEVEDGEVVSAEKRLAIQDALLFQLRQQQHGTSSHATDDVGHESSANGSSSFTQSTAVPNRDVEGGVVDGVQEAASPHTASPLLAAGGLGGTISQAQRELMAPWVTVEAQEARTLQMQFTRDFPFHKFEGRLTSAEMLDVKSTLIHDSMSDIIVAAVPFLVSAYLRPLSQVIASSVEAADTDAQFLRLCCEITRFFQSRQRSSSPVVLEETPLCILCIRVVVRAIFTLKLPSFFRTERGRAVQRKMDLCILSVLDPFGLQSHIAVLESTLQAQRLLRTKRAPPKMNAFATTPLIQFIVGDGARSTEAKRLTRISADGAAAEGLKELRAHLTPAVRAELLRLVSSEKILRDVN